VSADSRRPRSRPSSRKSTGSKGALRRPPRSVAPDSLDFRDRKFAPAVDRAPAAELMPPKGAKHGAFDDDRRTQLSVIANILNQPIPQ
jgi:hypothetical protein